MVPDGDVRGRLVGLPRWRAAAETGGSSHAMRPKPLSEKRQLRAPHHLRSESEPAGYTYSSSSAAGASHALVETPPFTKPEACGRGWLISWL